MPTNNKIKTITLPSGDSIDLKDSNATHIFYATFTTTLNLPQEPNVTVTTEITAEEYNQFNIFFTETKPDYEFICLKDLTPMVFNLGLYSPDTELEKAYVEFYLSLINGNTGSGVISNSMFFRVYSSDSKYYIDITSSYSTGSSYELPVATSDTLGGVKIGATSSIEADPVLMNSDNQLYVSNIVELPNLGTLNFTFPDIDLTTMSWSNLPQLIGASSTVDLTSDQITVLNKYFDPLTGKARGKINSFIFNETVSDSKTYYQKATLASNTEYGLYFSLGMLTGAYNYLNLLITLSNNEFYQATMALDYDALFKNGVLQYGQEKLTSGTNIKTINGSSILGSGNLYIDTSSDVNSVRVSAGTGLVSSDSSTQTGNVSTTISIDSSYKLPTTTERANKADSSTVTSVSSRVSTLESKDHYKISVSGTTLTITAE